MVTSRRVDPRLLHPGYGVHVEGTRDPTRSFEEHSGIVSLGSVGSEGALVRSGRPQSRFRAEPRTEPMRDEALTNQLPSPDFSTRLTAHVELYCSLSHKHRRIV
jgi:hypothetical protein